MEFLIFIVIIVGLFMFAFYMLPVLIPVLIILSLIGAVRRALQKNRHENEFVRTYEEYYSNMDQEQPKVQTREKRPDAIDVEFTEHEEKDETRS